MDAQLIAFTGVAAGMVALPGADFTVVVRNSLVSRRAGVACALGVAGGLLVHTALAVAGVAAVLTAVPALFRAFQIAGGVYVLHLGARTLQSALRPLSERGAPDETGVPTGGALRQGFLTNTLNPKAPITFLSVLPQFVPAGSPALPRTAVLSAIVVAFALLWFPAVALLVDRLGRWLRRPRMARRLEAVTGGALVALALVLLLEPLFA
ncbi:LysE family translocator [Streptomyces sp. VRA16 Mangrove soil]|uniref:LysE family translocator n=1 Tax=Streptomyces sp. VRA16 Mangrove soil TaxID=2817434 RepID=UPI001A9F35B7|nr:LysE family translocator [Streptomyces sp. VRA16 Mangrove soil]MBO1332391.1 LysE family translocator [Streptomyces sp. VRA16 Mangrove soil]